MEQWDIEDLTNPFEDPHSHLAPPPPEMDDNGPTVCQCTSPSNCDCLEKAKECVRATPEKHHIAFATASFDEEGANKRSISPPPPPSPNPTTPRTPQSFPPSQKTSFFFNTPLFTREEVAKHNTPKDCWLIANGNVYDATPYLHEHPAGPRAILRRAGKDVTSDFEFHSSSAQKRFKALKIGEVDEDSLSCSIC